MMNNLVINKTGLLIFIMAICFSANSYTQENHHIDSLVSFIKMADKLPLDESSELLLREIGRCNNNRDSIKCKTILYFNLGYFYHKEANKNLDTGEQLYEKAKLYYQLAQKYSPNDVGILNNLALVYSQLNEPDKAIQLLQRALEINPENKRRVLVNIGEIYSQNNQQFDAINSYFEALKENPDDESLAWSILEACYSIEYSEDNLKEIIRIGNNLMEYEHNLPAKSCFELALKYANNWEKINSLEEAILKWAEIISMNEQILVNEQDRLRFLNNAQFESFSELDKMINSPLKLSYSTLGWWTDNEERRHVAASVLKGVATRYILNDSLSKAVNVYELALKVSPELNYYGNDENKKEPVRIDIAITLAGLFHKYKEELDPDGRRFANLESNIFDEKNMFYLHNDLFAIQRSHIILANIYVERSQYESGRYAHDAIFQLERAIRFQERINEEYKGYYKPVPHLKQLLAEGYKNTGNQNPIRTYLEAAMDYLDTDNLKLAGEMLDEIKKIDFAATNRRAVKEVEEIVDLRKEINNLYAEGLNESSYEFYQTIVNNNSLFGEHQNLDDSFVKRQRFKIFSDAGRLYSEKSSNYTFPVFESRALENIMDETNLTSTQDYYRIKQINESLRNTVVDDESKRLLVSTKKYDSVDLPDQNQKTWYIASDNQSKTELSVSNDLLFSASIYSEIIKTDEFNPAQTANYDFKVNKGELILPSQAEATNINPEIIERVNRRIYEK